MDKGLEQIIAALRMKRAAIKNLLRNMGERFSHEEIDSLPDQLNELEKILRKLEKKE